MQKTYKQQIEVKLAEIISEMGIEQQVEVSLTPPPTPDFGDYSSHLALDLARVLKQNPLVLAEEFAKKLNDLDFIEKTDIVKPGYLNFFLSKEKLVASILQNIIETKHQEAIDKKIVIEHTSVNPNKAMHVGHLRNSILGDALARLFRSLGYRVEVQNYIDDTGLQVADTTNAILSLNKQPLPNQRFDDFAWGIYAEINKLYETRADLVEKRSHISEEIEKGNNEIATLAYETVNKIVDNHLELMSEFGILYDLLVYESDVIKFGFWETAFEKIKQTENFKLETEGKNAGCWVLKIEDPRFGDKVFVRSNGTKIYTAKDTAYHMWKFGLLDSDFKYCKWQRQFLNKDVYKTDKQGEEKIEFGKADEIINVIDERQSYPQEMVKYALKSLGYEHASENYHHLAFGVVNLSKETAAKLGIDTSDGKTSYAMSGRKGVGVKTRDLLSLLIEKIESERKPIIEFDSTVIATSKDVAVAALKHYMLKSNPSSAVTFDYEQAIQLTGNTGPYLQYSHARAAGILKAAGAFDYSYTKQEAITSGELELVRVLSEWDELKRATAKSLNLSLIADYAFRVSAKFHSFYETNIVNKAEDDVKKFRLTIVNSYKKIIAEVLDIMGIVAPERM